MPEASLRAHIDAHPDIQAGRAIALIWSVEDLLGLEDANGNPTHPINEREAAEILQAIERRHDASYGITWDTLEDAIHAYILDNPRSITRAEVAVGRGWGGHESGGWDLIQVELPTHRLESLNDQQLQQAFEAAAMHQLDVCGEACVFVHAICWEVIERDEEENDRAADRA